ncbi:MAG: nucleotidyl transferase AbiEii/AbiGii toxin family protein [Thiothrix sp.]
MIGIIQQRLARYQVANLAEEAQALKEIMQELALYGLWRGGFFAVAAFQGGTSLRILHQLPRFSEDLDFILRQPQAGFDWQPYLQQLLATLELFGLKPEVLDKSRMEQPIRKAVLKDNSIVQQLNLAFYPGQPGSRNTPHKLKIKLEIDINPPAGSGFDWRYLDFPLDFEVCHQDLPSNFALKIHALLCRPYVKGRDWYDFNWYVKQGVKPNLAHLQAALQQTGSWQGQNLPVDFHWLQQALLERVTSIDWQAAVQDVERFVSAIEQPSLRLWSERFYSQRVEQLFRGKI